MDVISNMSPKMRNVFDTLLAHRILVLILLINIVIVYVQQDRTPFNQYVQLYDTCAAGINFTLVVLILQSLRRILTIGHNDRAAVIAKNCSKLIIVIYSIGHTIGYVLMITKMCNSPEWNGWRTCSPKDYLFSIDCDQSFGGKYAMVSGWLLLGLVTAIALVTLGKVFLKSKLSKNYVQYVLYVIFFIVFFVHSPNWTLMAIPIGLHFVDLMEVAIEKMNTFSVICNVAPQWQGVINVIK